MADLFKSGFVQDGLPCPFLFRGNGVGLGALVFDLIGCLTDAQRIKLLQVRVTAKEQDTGNDLVRMVHLFNAFFAGFLGHVTKALIFLHTVVQPVLADGRQLTSQSVV